MICFSPTPLPKKKKNQFCFTQTAMEKWVLNSSCHGVVFGLRMINEGSCPQKPAVFFLIRQAMLIKLLKCSLITTSPLILCFFPWGFMSICVFMCMSVSSFLGERGYDEEIPAFSPTCPLVLHEWVCLSFHHCDIHTDTWPGFDVWSSGNSGLSLRSILLILTLYCTGPTIPANIVLLFDNELSTLNRTIWKAYVKWSFHIWANYN